MKPLAVLSDYLDRYDKGRAGFEHTIVRQWALMRMPFRTFFALFSIRIGQLEWSPVEELSRFALQWYYDLSLRRELHNHRYESSFH